MDPNNLIRRYGFITLRAHVNESQVFEDFLTYFLPILFKHKSYAYTIEKDDTPDRHIHAFFECSESAKDKNNAIQPWIGSSSKKPKKFIKDFRKSIETKQTIWSHFWDSSFLPNTYEDVMKILGYVMKDPSPRRRGVKNISDQVIKTAVDFHAATLRIDDSCIDKDVKIINNKNFHICVEDFAKKNNMTVHDIEIIPKMTHARHSFQINGRDLKKYHAELKFMNEKFDMKSEQIQQILAYENNDPEILPVYQEFQDLKIRYNNQKDQHKAALEKLEKRKNIRIKYLENLLDQEGINYSA